MDITGFVPMTSIHLDAHAGDQVEPTWPVDFDSPEQFVDWDYNVLDILSTTAEYRVSLN